MANQRQIDVASLQEAHTLQKVGETGFDPADQAQIIRVCEPTSRY